MILGVGIGIDSFVAASFLREKRGEPGTAAFSIPIPIAIPTPKKEYITDVELFWTAVIGDQLSVNKVNKVNKIRGPMSIST